MYNLTLYPLDTCFMVGAQGLQMYNERTSSIYDPAWLDSCQTLNSLTFTYCEIYNVQVTPKMLRPCLNGARQLRLSGHISTIGIIQEKAGT